MLRYNGISINECKSVYAPSDDTFLMLRALERVRVSGKRVLEIGTGTGIIAIFIAKMGAHVTAVDINPEAVKCARENARMNKVALNVFESDLFERVPKNDPFDIIVFNPPYLPEDEEDENEKSQLSLAWKGGGSGIEVTKRFLEEAHARLTEKGEIYAVLSSLASLDELFKEAHAHYSYYFVEEEKFDFETIYVCRFVRNAMP